MGGFFGVVSRKDCRKDLFYGTDYHSHLGTKRGGLAVFTGKKGFRRVIHNIESNPFRSKFEGNLSTLSGKSGIGCISDTDDQPIVVGSRLGKFAIVTVGKINNIETIANDAYENRFGHFSEMSDGSTNPTELVAAIISREADFKQGIEAAQNAIDGSCSLLILTPDGIIAARDRFGKTPVILGEKDGAYCVASESFSFTNLGYKSYYELGPGEIILLTADGMESMAEAKNLLQICAFLWVYYGYPASNYEGINVEAVRNRNGEILAQNDIGQKLDIDMIAGIPDSGIGHAIGYVNQSKIPYGRPFVKYTPTWPRSFMPQDQKVRILVSKMKLIPIPELIRGKRLLFCEDSIVRGTQLSETIKLLFNEFGAEKIHMRTGCPPLIFSCRFLNFSRSRSELDFAGRKAIHDIEKRKSEPPELLAEYADPKSEKYAQMVEKIRQRLGLTSLRYQTLPDLIKAIGLPKKQLCTYCWDGVCPKIA